MFSENNQISGRQLNRMLVLDLFAAASMILPRLLPRICGRQGVYAILAAAVFILAGAAVYIRTAFCCEDNFYNLAKRQTGSVFAVLMVLFFIVKFLWSAVFILKMFSEVISRTFLTQMPERVIAALMILTALYHVSKGIETRGRLSELLVWIVLAPIMLIVFLSAFEMKHSRIFPMQMSRPSEIVSAGLLCAAVFNVFEFLLFSVPYVRRENFKRIYRHTAWAIVTAVVCVMFIYIACIGVFSAKGAAAEAWPSVTLMQVIRLPGRFISRQDGLVLAVWTGAIFMLLSGYIFYTDALTKQLFPKKYFKGTMLVWLLLVYGLFWAIKDYGAFEKFYWQLMAFFGMPGSLLIAVWLFMGQRFKKRLCLLLVLFLVLPMTACKNTVQLEDRNYVMALGLDADKNMLKATFSFPDLEALTGKGGNIHYPVMTVNGNNLDEIEQSYRRMSSRRLDYGQLQVIVFGSKLLENKPMMETVLAYMKTRSSFTRTILVCQAKETAAEIIGLDASVNGSIGIYIREMFENNAVSDGYEKTIINDLMIGWKDEAEAVPMAVLIAKGEGDEKMPEICGVSNWP